MPCVTTFVAPVSFAPRAAPRQSAASVATPAGGSFTLGARPLSHTRGSAMGLPLPNLRPGASSSSSALQSREAAPRASAASASSSSSSSSSASNLPPAPSPTSAGGDGAGSTPQAAAPPAPPGASPPATAPQLRVCRVCKQLFDPAENHARACRYHPAMYTGRLLRVTPTETSGLDFFYDCCGATDVNAPGCTYGYHISYDD